MGIETDFETVTFSLNNKIILVIITVDMGCVLLKCKDSAIVF